MDRFKFRVWSNKYNDYLSPEIITTIMGLCKSNDLTTVRIGTLPSFDNNLTIEQCTGLKDKNGNLIYIGDIIKCGNGPLNTATVEYANGENFIDGIYPFNLYHDCGDVCHCQLRDYPEYACEIIGNIHQQKDSK